MNSNHRSNQLESELEALLQFAEGSEILSVERVEHAPRKIRLIFKGIGLGPGDTVDDEVEPRDRHECEVTFPTRYPDDPPELRWLTPLYHPNVSSSGFVDLDDFGCAWDADPSLTTLCECIWNTVRMARVDLTDVKNMTAKGWLERQTEFQLPLDARELRVSVRPRPENIVHYERRNSHFDLEQDVRTNRESTPVYIGDEAESDFVRVEIVEPVEESSVLEIREEPTSAEEDRAVSDSQVQGDGEGARRTSGSRPVSAGDARQLTQDDDLFFIGDDERGETPAS